MSFLLVLLGTVVFLIIQEIDHLRARIATLEHRLAQLDTDLRG
jgi:ubiquinone biosynthesis protein UbiJ